MKTLLNLTYCKKYKLTLDVYLPDTINFKTIVYFHGGGLEVGDKSGENTVEIAKAFVKNGYGFVCCNYRKYPKAKFPDFILDGAKVVAFVKQRLSEWGSCGIIVSGQSAGAYISLMLCLNKKYLLNKKVKPQEICGWIIDSAQTTSHYNVLKYELGEDSLAQRINEFAPLFFVDKNTNFSKMLLIFYENDMPCRYEQNMLFYKSILSYNKNADIEYKVLKGEHCAGSSIKDENGNYPFVLESLSWLKKSGL